MASFGKANLLGKREPKNDLETKPIMKKHKEKSEKETTKANLILVKETVEGLDDTPGFIEAVAVRKKTLFVSHLHQSNMSATNNFFKDVGKVCSVRFGVNREGYRMGYAFVEFAASFEAKKAQEKMITFGEFKIAPYPPRPKYCIEHKVWYEDYLPRESFPKEEEETPPHFVEAIAAREETLFVVYLSPQTKILHIINFFKDVGEVVSVRLIVNHEGKHVGYGFVEFASANEAKKALEKKNGEYLHDHRSVLDVPKTAPYSARSKYDLAEKLWYEDYLRRESLLIEEDETLEGLDETPDLIETVAVRKKTLFVSHLCRVNKFAVIDFFKDVGKVCSVRLGVNRQVKRVGFGFVEFASSYEAKKAQEKMITLCMAKIAPYPPRPKYCIEHKVWYEDYLPRESFTIEEEETPPHFFEEVAAREETLFVANLSPQTKMSHIIEFFEDVGEVFSVRLVVNPEGKHVGYGFVEFASSYEAKEALEEKNGEYLHDHRIFLDVAKTAPYSARSKYGLAEKLWYEDYRLRESLLIEEDEAVEGIDETPNFVEAVAVRKKMLFVSHLSRQTKMSDIIDFFKDVGVVFSFRLVVNHKGRRVGCGFVEFASAKKAKKAQEKKNGEYLCGNKITLSVAERAQYPPPKYCVDHKVWYEDYLRRESLLVEEDEAVEGLDETPDFVEIQEVAVRKKTLFIANLPLKPKIHEIIHFFNDVGEVFSVRLSVNYEGEHVGCGFVEFASANEAKKALEKKQGRKLRNSLIYLDVAEIAPYPLRPKYGLAEKLWYEDYLRRESLVIEEEENLKKQFCGKKITFSDDD